jgi:hypothetical protein
MKLEMFSTLISSLGLFVNEVSCSHTVIAAAIARMCSPVIVNSTLPHLQVAAKDEEDMSLEE